MTQVKYYKDKFKNLGNKEVCAENYKMSKVKI